MAGPLGGAGAGLEWLRNVLAPQGKGRQGVADASAARLVHVRDRVGVWVTGGGHAVGAQLQLALAHEADLELLDVEISPGMPGWLYGDAARLSQVLTNLLSNAVKFTSDGGVVVRASATERGADWLVHVNVTDTGIGIDDTTLSRLFSPSPRATARPPAKYGGTGLGLTISAEPDRVRRRP